MDSDGTSMANVIGLRDRSVPQRAVRCQQWVGVDQTRRRRMVPNSRRIADTRGSGHATSSLWRSDSCCGSRRFHQPSLRRQEILRVARQREFRLDHGDPPPKSTFQKAKPAPHPRFTPDQQAYSPSTTTKATGGTRPSSTNTPRQVKHGGEAR